VSGDEWPATAPHVVSGHIHEYHHPQPNVWYPGTPLPLNFSDAAARRVLLVDPTGQSPPAAVVLDVPLNVGMRVDIAGVPALLVSLAELPDRRPDRVRVFVTGSPSECRVFEKSSDHTALSALNVSIRIKPRGTSLPVALPAVGAVGAFGLAPAFVDLVEHGARSQGDLFRNQWELCRRG
jgi:hypothetical protein